MVGTLSLEGQGERLEYSLLEGSSCRSAEVIGYLVGALASGAERAEEEVVVVLDNAPFHTAGAVREREEGWEEMGLSLCSGFRRTARTSTSSRGYGEGSRVSSCRAASTTRWAS